VAHPIRVVLLAQIILQFRVVTLAQQLQEPKNADSHREILLLNVFFEFLNADWFLWLLNALLDFFGFLCINVKQVFVVTLFLALVDHLIGFVVLFVDLRNFVSFTEAWAAPLSLNDSRGNLI